MKVFKVRLNDGYKKLILKMVKDVTHLRNMLIILRDRLYKRMDKIVLDDNTIEYKENEISKLRFKVIDFMYMRNLFSLLNKGKDNGDTLFIKEVLEVYPSITKDILKFYNTYSNKIFVDIIKTLKANIVTASKISKDSFKLKPRKLSKIYKGSIDFNSNIVKNKNTYIDIQVFTKDYKKEHNIAKNLRLPFKVNKYIPSSVNIKNVILKITSYSHCYMYITYEENEKYHTPNFEKNTYSLGIDPGVVNCLTLASDNPKSLPIIIRHRAINRNNYLYQYKIDKYAHAKSKKANKNEYDKEYYFYTKYITKLHERLSYLRMEEIKKITSRIINYCLKYNITRIFFGYNEKWRTKVSLGHKTNRKMLSFPLYALKENLKWKASLHKIELIEQEESYTSKFSCINSTYPIWKYVYGITPAYKYMAKANGSRTKRSLYKDAATNTIFNADVNGAYNILQKGLKSYVNISKDQLYHPILVKDDFDFLKYLARTA